jgi:hypothetical protein
MAALTASAGAALACLILRIVGAPSCPGASLGEVAGEGMNAFDRNSDFLFLIFIFQIPKASIRKSERAWDMAQSLIVPKRETTR